MNMLMFIKALAKWSNIVGPTFEICLSGKMLDRLAAAKNIARPTSVACIKQKMFHQATNFAFLPC